MFTKTMNGTYENIDCMELMANIKDKEVDLAIVDPPYGIERMNRIGNDKNNRISLVKSGMWNTKPSRKYFKELFRVSKNQIIFGANNFILPYTEYFIVWDKQQTVDNFASAEYAWTNVKKPAKIFQYSIHKHNQNKSEIHPTEKPIKLYEWLLTNYAKPNDLILDTHVGSASSLIACENLGFKYIASELDKDYYSESLKRLQNHLSQGKLFQRVGRDEIRLEQPSMFA